MIEKDPLITTLELSKKIAKNMDDVKNILQWSVFAGIWVLWIVAVFLLQLFLGIFIPGKMTLAEAYIFMFSVILGCFAAWGALFPVFVGPRLYKSLAVWNEGFNKFYYTFAVETSLPKSANPQEKICNTIQEAFPEIKELIEKNPDIVQLNTKVQGKKSEHIFEVYSHLYTRGSKDFGELFVRRFDEGRAVDKTDMEKFAGDVEDVYRKHYRPRFRVVAVSTTSFTEDAKGYARNKNIWRTMGLTPDLIEEKPEGYKVVWAGGKVI